MNADIQAIATRAGVSTATVSRAINHPGMVLPATRDKIMAIVKELDYAPNPFAHGLSTGKTKLIALIVPTLNNTFFGQIVDGSQRFLISEGFNLIIISSHEYEKKDLSVINSLDQRKIEGIILSGSGFYTSEYKKILGKIKIPLVIIENLPDETNISSVYIDDINGTTLAIEHLLSEGHKKIGIIAGNQQMIATTRRLKSVKSIFKKHNMPLSSLKIVYGEYDSLKSGAKAFNKLKNVLNPPTAIFAFNDILALGALKEAIKTGVKVPKNIAIIGFDDIPMASYYSPALSTIHSPSMELGEHAASLMIEQLKTPNSPIKKIILPVELVIRATC